MMKNMEKKHVELRGVYHDNMIVYENLKKKCNDMDKQISQMKKLMFDFFNVWNEHEELRPSLKSTKDYICSVYKTTKYVRKITIQQISLLKKDIQFYRNLLSKY